MNIVVKETKLIQFPTGEFSSSFSVENDDKQPDKSNRILCIKHATKTKEQQQQKQQKKQ